MLHRSVLFYRTVLRGAGVFCTAFISTIAGATEDWLKVTPVDGFGLEAELIGEAWGDVRGGISRGSGWNSLLVVESEVDGRLLSIDPGWRAGVTGLWTESSRFSEDRVGSLFPVSNIEANSFMVLQQAWVGWQAGYDSFGVQAGQLAVDAYFMVAEPALLFLNSGFGPMPILSENTGAAVYPLGAPGVRLYGAVTESLTIQGGMFAGDAGPDDRNNWGDEWSAGGAGGWLWMLEGAWRPDDLTRIVAGGFYTSQYVDRFSTGTPVSGQSGVYGQFERGGEILNGRQWAAFVRGGIAGIQDKAAVGWYADTGVTLGDVFTTGEDRIGIGFLWGKFGDDAVADSRLTNPDASRAEMAIELTWQWTPRDFISIQPDVQYIMSPESGAHNALVVGCRCSIAWGM